MKGIHFYLLLVLLPCFFSCQKEFSFEGGNEPDSTGNNNPVPVKSEWEFSETGTRYYGPVDTAWLQASDNQQVLQITGRSASGDEKILLVITDAAGKILPGKTYQTTRFNCKFIYSHRPDTLMSAIPYYGGELFLTITSIDSAKVTGTFNGLVNTRDRGQQRISSGKFSSPLKTLATDREKGSLIYWSKGETGKPVHVRIGQEEKLITQFTLITPDCGEEGRANFSLPPGNFDYVAWSGKDTVRGTTTIKAASCKKENIFFPIVTSDTTITEDVNCRLAMISFMAPDPNRDLLQISNIVTAEFSGTLVNSLTYYTSPAPVPLRHPVTRSADTLFIDEGTVNEIYFINDAQGRVRHYAGKKFPENLLSEERVHAEYEYDGSGNMVRRITKNSRGQELVETEFIWQAGNIVKIIDHYRMSNGYGIETRIDYFTDKAVYHLPFLHKDAFELFLFQPAINLGNSCRNIPKKIYMNVSNSVQIDNDFSGYFMDGNKFVFQMSRKDKNLFETRFAFDYRCF